MRPGKPRPMPGKWVVRTDQVVRYCASRRAAERLMGDHMTNGGRSVVSVAGVIYDPDGAPVVGAMSDGGIGWAPMDPEMVEAVLYATV